MRVRREPSPSLSTKCHRDAKAYQRDLPKAELHLLDTGHFALEEEGDFIAERIKAFLKMNGGRSR